MTIKPRGERNRLMLMAECTALGVVLWAGVAALGGGEAARKRVAGMTVPDPTNASTTRTDEAPQTWRLNNPAPVVIPEERANPSAVADKFAARVRSMESRARLRAYEGAPPVIPHTTADMNLLTCRACHASGLQAGEKVARMASHAYLTNCLQCHVEDRGQFLEGEREALNSFVGLRPSAYGARARGQERRRSCPTPVSCGAIASPVTASTAMTAGGPTISTAPIACSVTLPRPSSSNWPRRSMFPTCPTAWPPPTRHNG